MNTLDNPSIVNSIAVDGQILNRPKYLEFDRGAKVVYYKQEVASSNTNVGQISFSNIIAPSGLSSVLPDATYMEMYLTVAATGSVTDGGNLFRPGLGQIYLRQFPFQSCVLSDSLTINSQTIQLSQQYQWIQQLAQCGGDSMENAWIYGYPPDQAVTPAAQANSIRNPGAPYLSTAPYSSNSRSGPVDLATVNSNSTTAFNLSMTIRVPIVSPVLRYNKQREGIKYVSSYSYTANMANLNRFFVVDNTSFPTTVSALTVTFSAAPVLLQRYLVMQDIDQFQQPPIIAYPSASITCIVTSVGSVNSGASFSIATNATQLRSCPTKIVQYVGPQSSSLSYTNTDYTTRLTSSNQTFGSQGSLMGGASEWQIFNSSVSAGLTKSWDDVQQSGMILCMIPAKEFQLASDETNGVQKTFNHASQLTGVNIGATAVLQCVTLYIFDQVLQQESSGANHLNDILITPEEAARMFQQGVSKEVALLANQANLSFGGSALSDIGNFFKGVYNTLAPIGKAIGNAVAPEFSGLINAIPSALGRADRYRRRMPRARGVLGDGTLGGRRYM